MGCREPVLGPSYSCIKCKNYYHHKSCTELPRELQHPLHPKHLLILFDERKFRKDKEYSKCEVCKEFHAGYTYSYSRCNFNIHNGCASSPLTLEFEVHNHPLTHFWKLIKFTCDLCGKEGNVVPYLCAPCNFWTHNKLCFLPMQGQSYMSQVSPSSHFLLKANLTFDFVNFVSKK